MKKFLLGFILSILCSIGFSQAFLSHSAAADHWVDSVFQTLSKNQKIAQLMVLRESSIKDGKPVFYDSLLLKYIKKYKIGSVCLFQGTPEDQALVMNRLQAASAIPLLVCIDGENGLGMRMEGVGKFPDQLTIGAIRDPGLVYAIGQAMGRQSRRAGIQVDYAPVVDINNNPDNPVIGYRSFGQDKYTVASYGAQIVRGLQSEGVMATAKHFPGHGDVDVDSHLDLPVIHKSMEQLDTLELFPFRELFHDSVGSVMIAHLNIPAIDSTHNMPTSLSYNNVTNLLRKRFNYKGISFTDALEMKGVAKFFPAGEAAVQSLVAGNDMLCLPGDIDNSIRKIRKAIRKGKLNQFDIDQKVKKVLLAKYNLGLYQAPVVDTAHLTEDLNRDVVPLREAVAKKALTLLHLSDPAVFSLRPEKVAYIGVGASDTYLGEQLKAQYGADLYYFDYKDNSTRADSILKALQQQQYAQVVIGIHNYSKRVGNNNFGISQAAIDLVNWAGNNDKSVVIAFGNPYAVKYFDLTKNLIAAYEDDAVFQKAALNVLQGESGLYGRLPVTVNPLLPYNYSIAYDPYPTVAPAAVGLNAAKLDAIDSIVNNSIAAHAFPGCQVLVARRGKVAFYKNYGYLTYDNTEPVRTRDLYDLASCTKISASTVSVMRLFDEGRLNIYRTLGDYMPWVRGTDKADLLISDVLLHQAGFVPYIPFYKATLDSATGIPLPGFYSPVRDSLYSVEVTEKMFLRKDYLSRIDQDILNSKLGEAYKYVYSDNDFIMMGRLVQQITGKPLDQYAAETFYRPMGMATTTFRPLDNGFPASQIAPTEDEKIFRRQQIRGTVHDPGAALMGGVAGHAGLFSNAFDLAKLYLMMLNGGSWNGKTYLKKTTIDFFTAYNSPFSRRGLGFDKPLRDNAASADPYPARQASPATFGHTGFTGTCIWADPKEELLFIFLSNRVYPEGNSPLLGKLNVREKILEAAYDAIER